MSHLLMAGRLFFDILRICGGTGSACGTAMVLCCARLQMPQKLFVVCPGSERQFLGDCL